MHCVLNLATMSSNSLNNLLLFGGCYGCVSGEFPGCFGGVMGMSRGMTSDITLERYVTALGICSLCVKFSKYEP